MKSDLKGAKLASASERTLYLPPGSSVLPEE